MNKLPAKQIYLLTILVIGIFSISAYSTYAIFTYETTTANVISINTPNSLSIFNNKYEYKQIIVPKNSYLSTDIDIYNYDKNDMCYGIWYKPLSESNKVKVYQNTDSLIDVSGILNTMDKKRISLIITNDADNDVKVNLGVSSSQASGNCELNISKDRYQVKDSLNNPKNLTDTIIANTTKKEVEDGYITYKDEIKEITLEKDKKIYISKDFTISNELFTLKDYEEIEVKDINLYQSNNTDNYYTCLTKTTCDTLYRIINTKEVDKDNYVITKYDKLIGYLGGANGLRKINNDYLFYGDSPNNYLYFNCTNELDNKTCELWRIIGFIYDEVDKKYITKIIKDESIGLFKYDDTKQNWNESYINEYLNKEYKIHTTANLKEITFKQENIESLDGNITNIKHFNNENKSVLTIMDVTDYLNASVCEKEKINEYTSGCLKNNWLNKNTLANWTKTSKYLESYTNSETGEVVAEVNDMIYSVSDIIKEEKVNKELNIRPVAILKARTFLIDGDGGVDNPYVIR